MSRSKAYFFLKFLGSEEKKVETRKEDVKEITKSLPKEDQPKKENKPAEVNFCFIFVWYHNFKTVAPTAGGFGDFMAKTKKETSGNWTCPICMMSNAATLAKCPACEAPNPNMAPPKVNFLDKFRS